MLQFPADCLIEIFEYLEKDKVTLHSCVLINRLWCEVAVRILWRNVWNYNTLITCLPNESKEILHKNGINILTPTSKPPMFNYARFCRNLNISQVNHKIEQLLKSQQSTSQNLNNKTYLIAQELYKLFMSQISSLKLLDYCFFMSQSIIFTSYPGARDCLKDLSVLYCRSNICPGFFYQLSQICHVIQTLRITFEKDISNGLTDLISVQQNLKYLTIIQYYDNDNLADILPLLTNLPDNLIKLDLDGYYIPLSFITKFTNLQELVFSLDYDDEFDDLKKLQHVTFPQLQILKFKFVCSNYDLLITFLEHNGKNLYEFYVDGNSLNSFNLAVAKFCPNLRKLTTGLKSDELEALKMIFNRCQYLESISIWCGGDAFMNEKEALEVVVKYSPKNTHELILYHQYDAQLELDPKELETLLISWRNRIPQKPLTLIIVNCDSNGLSGNDENIKIIKNYIELGVMKRFKVINYDDDV